MKFLIIDTYYDKFLEKVYKKNESLKRMPYKKQRDYLLSLFFGTSDFYSYNLKKLGHQAEDIIANDEYLQKKWAKENNIKTDSISFLDKIKNLPLVYKILGKPEWIQEIVLAQIEKYNPDVVYMQNLSILNPGTLRKIKRKRFLVGQIASPMPNKDSLRQFDLIFSSFPHFVKKFRKMGISSEYLKIAFEPRILNKIGKPKRIYETTFIGGISPSHKKGILLLTKVAKKIKLDVWGYGKDFLPRGTKLFKSHHGEAWSFDMYKKLAQSKITINRHIDVAENYANNMRLYEATGMGAMLITDKKKNLCDLFEVGREVVEYKNADDLVKKIRYYLKNGSARKKIARAGQKRTLKEHTYYIRMKELVDLINKYI